MSDGPGAIGPVVRHARRDEVDIVAALVRESFATVAEEIGFDIPPLHESTADVLAAIDAGDAVLLAEYDGVPVGTVRGDRLADGSVVVRRLAVLPSFRRHGLARLLMTELEAAYPEARRFELFTGAEARVPIALYESLGYAPYEPASKPDFPLVYLEKCREA